MDAINRRVSFTDLLRMPDDGNRYELYDGELHVVPSPVLLHQRIVGRLYLLLSDYVKSAGGEVFLAPLDIVLTEYDVVEPDLIYFGREKAAQLNPLEHVRFAPDLAIEVLSPSTARIDRGRKSDLLARHHVPEYWLIEPHARTLEVRIERDGHYADPIVREGGLYRSVTLPGMSLDITALFA